MDGSVFTDLVSGPAELARAVLAFNGLAGPPPGPWPPELEGHPLAAALKADSRLGRFFPAGGREVFWDFREEPRRLALLDGESLRRLKLFWGAAVWAPLLAGVIEGRRVRALKEELGPELYGYVLGRGRFHLGRLRPVFQIDPPDLFPGTVPALEAAGTRAVALCRLDWPEPLKQAAGVPGEAAAPSSLAALTPHRRQVWLWLKKILLSEAAPQWQPCFP